MSYTLRIYRWERTILLIGAIALLGGMGHANVQSGERQPPVATSIAPVAPVTTSQAAPANPSNKTRLVTVEEVYAAMFEAERRRTKAARADASIDNRALGERWGVQVFRVSYAADGFWLDFSFQVTDPIKAGVLFDNHFKPYLQSEASGLKFAVPTAAKVGALRTTNRGHNIQAGKIYSIMFANPGFHVKPGQQVTVAAGDFKVEHLTVRGGSHNLIVKK